MLLSDWQGSQLKKIIALPAVFKKFATPVEVISWKKSALMHWSNSGFVTY
jgi:hypothetical protein